MPGPAARGVVSISIDADGGSSASARAADEASYLVVELLDRFQQHRFSGTWVFSDPAGTPLAARRITCNMPQQEVALLATLPATGAEISRGDVVRTIVRRLQLAAAAGISVTSLALTGCWHSRNIDLLTKHGITIVRTHGPAADLIDSACPGISKLDAVGAHAICHGLWHVPVAATLRGGGWLANRIQSVRVLRSINRTAARGGMCHVRIDAAAIAAGDGRKHCARWIVS